LCSAAIVLGSIVGILVAITLTLQFNLFTELPFEMEFPFIMYFTLIGICLITALVGSYYPLSQMKKYSISVALRGLND
jgi:ABC-type antimicrobial peptide transport system permease subunit